jgi:hypothetical protein
MVDHSSSGRAAKVAAAASTPVCRLSGTHVDRFAKLPGQAVRYHSLSSFLRADFVFTEAAAEQQQQWGSTSLYGQQQQH